MTTSYNLRKKLQKKNYRNIEIYNYNYFEAHKKENESYHQSVKYSKLDYLWMTTYEKSLEYIFYNFQLLVELLTRFQKEIQISDKSINYLISAHEELKLSYRFLYLWYYNTSWIHLRWFFEKMIHFILFHYDALGKLDKIPTPLKDKINLCLKIWELSHKNTENIDKDIYNQYYFPVWEIMKLYQFYSIDYVHEWKPNSDLYFDAKEYKKLYFLIQITLIYIPRFLKATIGEQIEKYWKHEILNPLGECKYYWNYMQFFFGENKFITNQYSEIYNLIHDDPEHKKYAFEELKLDINNLFEKEYLKEIKISDKLRKKAKCNKDKYKELSANYYKDKSL